MPQFAVRGNTPSNLFCQSARGVQQFVTDSPWSGAQVFEQIQCDIKAQPLLGWG